MVVLSQQKCPGVEGEVCNQCLPSKEHDCHRLCVACRDKSCKSDDWCEECHNWLDDHCSRVSDYLEKLLLQQEKKRERKTKSYCSFSGFSPSMPVPLGQLPSSAGSGVVTSTPSASTSCAVTFSVFGLFVSATLFVPSSDVTLVDPNCKHRRVEGLLEQERMLVAFKDVWASRGSFSPWPGPSSASKTPLVTPSMVVPAPGPSVVPVTVSATSAAALSNSSHLGALSACLYEWLHSRHSPGPHSVSVGPGLGFWGFPFLFPGPICHLFPFPGPVFHPGSVSGPAAYPLCVFGLVSVAAFFVCAVVGEFPLLVVVLAFTGYFPFSLERWVACSCANFLLGRCPCFCRVEAAAGLCLGVVLGQDVLPQVVAFCGSFLHPSHSPVSKGHHCRPRRHLRPHQSHSADSSQGGSHKESSSRGGSASYDGERHRSCSCTLSLSRREDKDRQEEHSLLDFVLVAATLHSLNEPLEAPSESHKVCGFSAALEGDNQSALLYRLPVGGASEDILADIDDRISSPSGMCLKRVLKLLQYPGVRSRCFYRFEVEGVAKAGALNHHVTELERLHYWDNLNKADVILSSSEAEDMEATLKSIVEATSWMDWWIVPGTQVHH